MKLDHKKISNIQFEGIDHEDYPDYCDAYVISADYGNEAMTEQQLECLNDDRDFLYDKLMEYLF